MADQTAFFTFGTNAEETAAQITAAMAQIQRAVSTSATAAGGGTNFAQETSRDIAGLKPLFARAQGEIETGVGQINDLLRKAGSGTISPEAFREGYRKTVSEMVGGIPRMMSEELARAPEQTALRTNVQQLGGTLANDYVRYFEQALQQNRGIGGAALRGMRLSGSGGLADPNNFVADIMGVAQRGPAWGQERIDQPGLELSNLINRVRAEKYVAADPLGGKIQPPPGIASAVQYYRELADAQGRIQENVQTGATSYVPSGAAQELSELTARMREAEKVSQSLGVEWERETARAEQLAIAERLLAEGAQRVGSRTVDESTGQVFKDTAYGSAPETNPARAENAVQAAARMRSEAQNSQMLADNFSHVQDVAGYQVMGDQVFKKTSSGHAELTPMDNAYEYQRVLEATAAARQKDLQAAQRLNEFNGKQVARTEAGNSGFTGGFLQRFQRGEQNFATGMGGQAASAAAFSLAYGAIFGLQNVIRDTIGEFKDFQDSYTDLQVATRNSDVVTGDFVNTLGELARVSGSNLGESLDTAARAIRAFGDPAGSTAQQMRDIGVAANEASTQLALIANKSLPDATGDVIAIGTAYNMRPDQFSQIVDAISNAKRTLGGDPTQIAQGLAYISQAATEAGYSLNEAAAVISLVQARTDESGQAIATRLGRVFQIIKGSTGKSLSAQLGVDSTKSVKDQIEQYGKILSDPNTSKAVQDRITSALGGTANLRELLPLLKEGTRLQLAYKAAEDNAGQGADEFRRQSENLVGTLKKISGDIRLIQVNLSRTGLFAPAGLAVNTLEPVLHSLDRMIELWNKMPTPIKNVLGLLIDVALISKSISVIEARNLALKGAEAGASGGIVSRVFRGGASTATSAAATEATAALTAAQAAQVAAMAEGTAAREAENAGIAGATEARVAAEAAYVAAVERAAAARTVIEGESAAAGAAGSAGRFAGIRGGLATMGRFIASPVGIGVAAVVGAGYLYDKIATGKDQRTGFEGTADAASKAMQAIDGSAQSVYQAATDLMAESGKIRKSPSNGMSSGEQKTLADQLQMQSQDLHDIAKGVLQEEQRNAARGSAGVFGSGAIETVDQLSTGLTNLSLAGGTAVTAMRALRKALYTDTPQDTLNHFQPHAFASNLLGSLFGDPLTKALPKNVLVNSGQTMDEWKFNPKTGTSERVTVPIPKSVSAADAARMLRENTDFSKLNQQILDEAAKMGMKPGAPVTQQQVDKLAKWAADHVDLSGTILRGADAVKTAWVDLILKDQKLTPPAQKELLNGTGSLSNASVLSMITPQIGADGSQQPALLQTQFAQQLADISPFAPAKVKTNVLRGQAKLLETMNQRNGGQVPALVLLMQQTEDAYVQSRVADLERLRQIAQSQHGLTKGQVRAIGTRYLTRELNTAADKGDIAQMINIMNQADNSALDAVEHNLKVAAQIAKAARDRLAALLAESGNLDRGTGTGGGMGRHDGDPGGILNQPSTAEKRYQDFKQARDQAAAVPNHGSNYSTGQDANSSSTTASDRYEAQQNAQAAQIGGQLAQDRAALNIAKYHLDHSKQGSVKWLQAQAEYANALRTYSADQRQVGVSAASVDAARLSGGIAQARSQIISAQAGLKEYAKGTAEYNDQLASLFQAQRAMRDAVVQYQINKFKLQGDMTDPVENARDALKGALAQLRSDAGSGKDVIAADQVAVRQSRESLLSEKFNQRLQDVQTAEQLGKISHEAYIRYLEHEHDRLTAVKHRTRQQTDELNQIDMALKDAIDSADGQFNLGDINVNGLVYQVRRFQAEQRAAAASGGTGDPRGPYQNPGRPVVNQNVQIHIDGADTAKVKSILTSVLGSDVSNRRTLRNRKV